MKQEPCHQATPEGTKKWLELGEMLRPSPWVHRQGLAICPSLGRTEEATLLGANGELHGQQADVCSLVLFGDHGSSSWCSAAPHAQTTLTGVSQIHKSLESSMSASWHREPLLLASFTNSGLLCRDILHLQLQSHSRVLVWGFLVSDSNFVSGGPLPAAGPS